jgi:GAF domain-containing protein
MLRHPELAPFAAQSAGRSTYVFPVFTAQQQYGVLAVTKERGQEFVREDVELFRSLTSHVAIALECALARDCAEQYQRELATERDRLRLTPRNQQSRRFETGYGRSISLGFGFNSFVFRQSFDGILAS